MRRTLTLAGAAVTLALGAGVAANAASQSAAGFRGANGRIAYEAKGAFVLISPDGTGQVRIPRTNSQDHSPSWSPDGETIAYQGVSASGDSDIYVVDGDGSARKQLTFRGQFDGDPSWSGDGATIAFESGGPAGSASDIWSIESDGSHLTRLTNTPGFDGDPAISPDGTRIAFTSDRDGNKELYVMNADGTDQTRLTNDGGTVANAFVDEVDENPVWSPNGRRIAFDSTRDGQFEIYSMNPDGSGLRRLTDRQSLDAAPAWSPDGGWIAFISDRANKDYRDIWVMRADGSAPHRVTHNATAQSPPDWQPLPPRPAGCTLWGTAGRDLLVSGNRSDVICGLAGKDTLVGGGGVDSFFGAGGNDTIDARDGRRELVDGGSGHDRAHLDKRDRARGIETRLR
jgi:Tol biopolymer transport system component